MTGEREGRCCRENRREIRRHPETFRPAGDSETLQWLEGWAGMAATARTVFVTDCPRSETIWFGRILSAHRGAGCVHIPAEERERPDPLDPMSCRGTRVLGRPLRDINVATWLKMICFRSTVTEADADRGQGFDGPQVEGINRRRFQTADDLDVPGAWNGALQCHASSMGCTARSIRRTDVTVRHLAR